MDSAEHSSAGHRRSIGGASAGHRTSRSHFGRGDTTDPSQSCAVTRRRRKRLQQTALEPSIVSCLLQADPPNRLDEVRNGDPHNRAILHHSNRRIQPFTLKLRHNYNPDRNRR